METHIYIHINETWGFANQKNDDLQMKFGGWQLKASESNGVFLRVIGIEIHL